MVKAQRERGIRDENRAARRRVQQRKASNSRQPSWVRWTVIVLAAAIVVGFFAAIIASGIDRAPTDQPAFR